VEGDAACSALYEGIVPANVVLVCGVFGNIGGDDIRTTIFELPRLRADGAAVIWTRHRRAPDLASTIRGWLDEAGFDEVAFDTEEPFAFGVGTHRFVGRPGPFRRDRRMFTFVGDGTDALL